MSTVVYRGRIVDLALVDHYRAAKRERDLAFQRKKRWKADRLQKRAADLLRVIDRSPHADCPSL